MLLNDFSQLAVLSDPKALLGAVSWRSIAKAEQVRPSNALLASDAMERAESHYCSERLSDVLPDIIERDYTFTKSKSGRVVGIITVADVAGKYAELTDPFLYCGEVDRRLRQALERVEIETIWSCLGRPSRRRRPSLDELTFGEYQKCLESEEVWEAVDWTLDQRIFVSTLDSVRKIRNSVMHFGREPISPGDLQTLRSFAKALHELTITD